MATDDRSERTYVPLTTEHLRRLVKIADADHALFSRGRPEYADRRVAVTLAQGSALHYLYGEIGVHDLDVWSFYAGLPGKRWPADMRNRHVDFGRSELGRELYDFREARTRAECRRWEQWSADHTGRRVDLFIRPLDVGPESDIPSVVAALRRWLELGSRSRARKPPSPWHLSQKAMILLMPDDHGFVSVWPAQR